MVDNVEIENSNNSGHDDYLQGDENDKVLQLMIENKILNCEKTTAETNVEFWKSKCTQLQLRVKELENTLATNCLLGTTLANTPPLERLAHVDGGKRGACVEAELGNRNRVRKSLEFAKEGSATKKMAPSTPAGLRPVVIDIDDSDDDTDFGLKKNELPSDSNRGNIHEGKTDEDDKVSEEGNISFISTPRRKRSCNVVTSDSESDDNDDVPISMIRNHRKKEHKTHFHSDSHHMTTNDSMDEVGGHRLKRLRKCEEKRVPKNGTGQEYHLGKPTHEAVDVEEDSLDSEGDSLNGFIVSNSEVSESNAGSDDYGASESDDDAHSADVFSDSEDVDLDYKEIISQIRRNRDRKMKWEFEADMLADFSKDPELCIRAVCALYRQQTSEEKFVKGTLVHNGRGFSQSDALRGSKLAEFLINGDPQDDVKKSVEQLQKYDRKGLEVCRQLASRYSKQLFEIYKSKEDPFFLPS